MNALTALYEDACYREYMNVDPLLVVRVFAEDTHVVEQMLLQAEGDELPLCLRFSDNDDDDDTKCAALGDDAAASDALLPSRWCVEQQSMRYSAIVVFVAADAPVVVASRHAHTSAVDTSHSANEHDAAHDRQHDCSSNDDDDSSLLLAQVKAAYDRSRCDVFVVHDTALAAAAADAATATAAADADDACAVAAAVTATGHADDVAEVRRGDTTRALRVGGAAWRAQFAEHLVLTSVPHRSVSSSSSRTVVDDGDKCRASWPATATDTAAAAAAAVAELRRRITAAAMRYHDVHITRLRQRRAQLLASSAVSAELVRVCFQLGWHHLVLRNYAATRRHMARALRCIRVLQPRFASIEARMSAAVVLRHMLYAAARSDATTMASSSSLCLLPYDSALYADVLTFTAWCSEAHASRYDVHGRTLALSLRHLLAAESLELRARNTSDDMPRTVRRDVLIAAASALHECLRSSSSHASAQTRTCRVDAASSRNDDKDDDSDEQTQRLSLSLSLRLTAPVALGGECASEAHARVVLQRLQQPSWRDACRAHAARLVRDACALDGRRHAELQLAARLLTPPTRTHAYNDHVDDDDSDDSDGSSSDVTATGAATTACVQRPQRGIATLSPLLVSALAARARRRYCNNNNSDDSAQMRALPSVCDVYALVHGCVDVQRVRAQARYRAALSRVCAAVVAATATATVTTAASAHDDGDDASRHGAVATRRVSDASQHDDNDNDDDCHARVRDSDSCIVLSPSTHACAVAATSAARVATATAARDGGVVALCLYYAHGCYAAPVTALVRFAQSHVDTSGQHDDDNNDDVKTSAPTRHVGSTHATATAATTASSSPPSSRRVRVPITVELFTTSLSPLTLRRVALTLRRVPATTTRAASDTQATTMTTTVVCRRSSSSCGDNNDNDDDIAAHGVVLHAGQSAVVRGQLVCGANTTATSRAAATTHNNNSGSDADDVAAMAGVYACTAVHVLVDHLASMHTVALRLTGSALRCCSDNNDDNNTSMLRSDDEDDSSNSSKVTRACAAATAVTAATTVARARLSLRACRGDAQQTRVVTHGAPSLRVRCASTLITIEGVTAATVTLRLCGATAYALHAGELRVPCLRHVYDVHMLQQQQHVADAEHSKDDEQSPLPTQQQQHSHVGSANDVATFALPDLPARTTRVVTLQLRCARAGVFSVPLDVRYRRVNNNSNDDEGSSAAVATTTTATRASCARRVLRCVRRLHVEVDLPFEVQYTCIDTLDDVRTRSSRSSSSTRRHAHTRNKDDNNDSDDDTHAHALHVPVSSTPYTQREVNVRTYTSPLQRVWCDRYADGGGNSSSSSRHTRRSNNNNNDDDHDSGDEQDGNAAGECAGGDDDGDAPVAMPWHRASFATLREASASALVVQASRVLLVETQLTCTARCGVVVHAIDVVCGREVAVVRSQWHDTLPCALALHDRLTLVLCLRVTARQASAVPGFVRVCFAPAAVTRTTTATTTAAARTQPHDNDNDDSHADDAPLLYADYALPRMTVVSDAHVTTQLRCPATARVGVPFALDVVVRNDSALPFSGEMQLDATRTCFALHGAAHATFVVAARGTWACRVTLTALQCGQQTLPRLLVRSPLHARIVARGDDVRMLLVLPSS